jgi:hypothetical protein
LLWTPSKQSRRIVTAVCASILVSRVAETWWLVLPEPGAPPRFWLDVAALLALGGPTAGLFALAWRVTVARTDNAAPSLSAEHG